MRTLSMRTAMANRTAYLCRHCRLLFPHVRRVAPRVTTLRLLSVEAADPLPPPPADSAPKVYPEKIQSLVRDISHLSLLETAQLSELLKTTLNIPDAPMMNFGAVPSATPVQEAETREESAQTEFTVKLIKFEDGAKVKLIKEVKTLLEGMNLVQAKKFVESVPQVVKKDVSKEEAEKLQNALEAAGGIVELE